MWIGDEATGEYTADTTDSSGNYSIVVKSGDYKIGVELVGYEPIAPTNITISTSTTQDFSLTSADHSISGTIYADANSNSTFDSGEQVADGWVWAEESSTKKIIGANTESDGTFSIPVANGTFTLKGVANGYTESSFGNITIQNANSTNNSIQLTSKSNWDSKLKSQPITPSTGGSLDDSGSSGSGVKITIPPNALGSDTSSGSIKSSNTSSVSKTSSANPLGSIGKEITATDGTGAAITNLSDDIELELVYYMSDIDSTLSDYTKLNLLTNSYWDTSVSNWVSMSTTKTAYTKSNSSDTDWTTVTDYEAFTSALQSNSSAYSDYKIALNSSSDHLTVFGATTPTDTTPPSAPTGLSQTSGSGTSVVLDWSDSSETDLLEYEIYRSTSANVTANSTNQVNSSQVKSSAFTDSTTTPFTVYYYTITAADDSSNESTSASEIQVCSTASVSNGSIDNSCTITCNSNYTLNSTTCEENKSTTTSSGGGGGGYFGQSEVTVQTTHQTTATEEEVNTAYQSAFETMVAKANSNANITKENATTSTTPINSSVSEMLIEASIIAHNESNNYVKIFNTKRNTDNESITNSKYISILSNKSNALTNIVRTSMKNFITYGTFTTQKLGAGERAGVINSYKSAFTKLPETQSDWEDIIKISNGRWPTQRSTISESKAKEQFEIIYKRAADRSNPHDDAAITVMAYGLRPGNRNLNSEKNAINSFKHIYKYHPTSAIDWDIVRAIAYSGAKR